MNGYLAAVLDKQSQHLLRGLAEHKIVHAHHMTIAFKPSVEVYGRYRRYLGKPMVLDVAAIASDDKGQAATVREGISENTHPHITISCAQGVKPSYSNELLKHITYIEKLNHLLILHAIVEWIDL